MERIYKQRFLLMLLVPIFIWYILFRYIPLLGNFLSLTNFGRSIHIKFVVYIPFFFSWVVVGSIFITMLSSSSGVINKIIEYFGGKAIYFMVSTFWFRPILVFSYIWRQVGYGTVIYIATISTIDPELYDAAKVDGANHFQRILNVTLPCIKSTIVTMLLLNLSHVLQIFDQIIVMQNAAVYAVSDVLRTYSFREGLENMNISYGIAIGLLTSLATAVLVTSLAKDEDVLGKVYLLYPKSFSLRQYVRIMQSGYFKSFIRSIIIATVGTIFSMIITLPGGYALAQKNLVGRKLFMNLIII